MAKKVYVGIDNKARKVKKIYAGIAATARKVKRGYIGIGGKARPFWTGGELAYWGSSYDSPRWDFAAASNDTYAMFAGGRNGVGSGSWQGVVTAYDKDLTRSNAPDLSISGWALAGAAVGNYIIFGGATRGSGANTQMETYNKELTKTNNVYLPVGRYGMKAASVGNYAIFGTGHSGSSSASSNVDAVDSNLTRRSVFSFQATKLSYAAASLKDYALFAGGASVFGAYVDAYNSALTRVTVASMSMIQRHLAAASTGNFAFFGGGQRMTSGGDGAEATNNVECYDNNLVKKQITPLSVSRNTLAASSIDDFAIFAGGTTNKSNTAINQSQFSDAVDAYDETLTKISAQKLSRARYSLEGASIGPFALFADGLDTYNSSSASSFMDIYTT